MCSVRLANLYINIYVLIFNAKYINCSVNFHSDSEIQVLIFVIFAILSSESGMKSIIKLYSSIFWYF
jgi:hypothetical protein